MIFVRNIAVTSFHHSMPDTHFTAKCSRKMPKVLPTQTEYKLPVWCKIQQWPFLTRKNGNDWLSYMPKDMNNWWINKWKPHHTASRAAM